MQTQYNVNQSEVSKPKKGLTKKQAEVLEAIRSFINTYEYSPSYQEIADNIGTVKSNIHRYVVQLEKRGYVVLGEGLHRTIALSEK